MHPTAPDSRLQQPSGLLTGADVAGAAERLRRHVRRTPLVEVAEAPSGARIALKLELLQRSGSFKLRGATNRLLLDGGRHRRVAAASGGNHGAAVALACHRLGLEATIFVPASSPAHKLALIEAADAVVRVIDAPFTEVAERCAEFANEHGALLVHSFEDEAVVAGQGTVGLELLEQWPEMTRVVVAVGGGGLAAGMAVALAGHAELIPAEPSACPTLAAALAAGGPTPVEVGGVAVDSLGAPLLGALAYGLLAPVVDDVVLVEEAAILTAQQRLWEECRLVVEPAAACAWAAATSSDLGFERDDRVAVIVCGGNVDPKQAIGGGLR